ncbi:MAG: alpha-amylase [Fusobacteriia bacterium 4572_132]|nr:MAG: alpha-amylase [Fusobacteriia bacterium 4572_132]
MEENNKNENYIPEDTNFEDEDRNDEKIIIYQMMTRLFGNSSDGNKKNGTIEENGVGKFNDITEKALVSLKKMGISHIWYTGVIEHATMTDYTKKGIKLDDADVVKGRAGSPYAIKDYYDVDPDLAENVDERMEEFQKLIERTHKMGLKAIIDFVPNHVARSYKSDKKPENVKDLGVDDDNSKFDPNNNFYYIVGEKFEVPEYNPLNELIGPNEDSKYDENPAKVTGNDVFSSKPKKYDWFETVKLNYGLDINGDNKTYFNPIPSTWIKMRDILKYWTEKGVDGFRCDMAEMVPYEFWGWVIPEIKKINPKVIFIAEIYNIGEYKRYINEGKFDYLYDKVGMYDYLRLLTQGIGSVNDLEGILKNEKGISSKMLKFLENHDEQRLASDNFAGDMWAGLPAMVISSTISTSPVMIYFGQEVGEKGKGDEGFNGEDGRTTIFDYWGVPEHQKWMNDKKFDGEKLSSEQKKLRKFYSKLLNITSQKEAIKNGDFYQIYYANRKEESEGWSDRKNYAYFRWNKQQKILIVLNFDRENEMKTFVKIPEKAFEKIGLNKNKKYIAKELLWENEKIEFEYLGVSNQDDKKSGIPIEIAPMSAKIFEIIEK